ncbi:hypothetical protein C6P77_23865 [Burkholderia ambifaria]|nr:hypothetical protein C6P77_23865 [Burkholderia ambifaria]
MFRMRSPMSLDAGAVASARTDLGAPDRRTDCAERVRRGAAWPAAVMAWVRLMGRSALRLAGTSFPGSAAGDGDGGWL